MALRKVCVRDFGALVVRRFAYAKTGCVRDSRRREKSRRVRKSRTQNRAGAKNRVRKIEYAKSSRVRKNRAAYANRVSKSRTPNRVHQIDSVNRVQLINQSSFNLSIINLFNHHQSIQPSIFSYTKKQKKQRNKTKYKK